MELFTKTLFLCLALALLMEHLREHHDAAVDDASLPDRCDGIGFDAITPDEQGTTFFFRGSHLWEGFHGPAQLSNGSFQELDDIGHVDAAFRMHNIEHRDDHDHIYFFLGDKVFSYYAHHLEEGYPKEIQQDFPGVPSHLDAAVECPKGECMTDSVLFFKGQDVHVYDIVTKTVKTKTWSHLPVCTSALRWLEHYYCFHGNNFTKFHPVSGEVSGVYPKDARSYFMKCPNYGHGGHYKAKVTSSQAPSTCVWTPGQVVEGGDQRGGCCLFLRDNIYLIKDDQVYIYKAAAHYTLIEGYPKTLKEELGIEGHVDAAFVCPDNHTVHIIIGGTIRAVDLSATPRAVTREMPLPFSDIDAALCSAEGVNVFKGATYYHYESPMTLAMSRIAPEPLNVTRAMMGCEE
ncbi:Hemopexin [Dissostichus eleginoides]|uniref:Hemopexin n=1 Tax=Dissostichus eleginoides TaxID=100907 RepID=A0AAD9B439_DISEL|nr:Hemopexin [Dissostichus eleginoides]